jgi:hypothetical protein
VDVSLDAGAIEPRRASPRSASSETSTGIQRSTASAPAASRIVVRPRRSPRSSRTTEVTRRRPVVPLAITPSA